jgi:hypothetical protein
MIPLCCKQQSSLAYVTVRQAAEEVLPCCAAFGLEAVAEASVLVLRCCFCLCRRALKAVALSRVTALRWQQLQQALLHVCNGPPSAAAARLQWSVQLSGDDGCCCWWLHGQALQQPQMNRRPVPISSCCRSAVVADSRSGKRV